MGDGVSSLTLGDLDLIFGDERSSEAGAEQVFALVNGAGTKDGEGVVRKEFLAEIEDVRLGGTGGEGLGLDAGEIFTLANVGSDSDDLAVVGFFDPLEDDRCIEPAGVGEDNLLNFLLGHAVLLSHSKTLIARSHELTEGMTRRHLERPGMRTSTALPPPQHIYRGEGSRVRGERQGATEEEDWQECIRGSTPSGTASRCANEQRWGWGGLSQGPTVLCGSMHAEIGGREHATGLRNQERSRCSERSGYLAARAGYVAIDCLCVQP